METVDTDAVNEDVIEINIDFGHLKKSQEAPVYQSYQSSNPSYYLDHIRTNQVTAGDTERLEQEIVTLREAFEDHFKKAAASRSKSRSKKSPRVF